MYKNSFKDMLKYLREREHLTQSELAKAVGLGSSTISMYELGSREPNFEIEERLADFFNVDIGTLRGIPASDLMVQDDDLSLLIEIYRNLDSEHSKALLSYANYLKNSVNKEDNHGKS